MMRLFHNTLRWKGDTHCSKPCNMYLALILLFWEALHDYIFIPTDFRTLKWATCVVLEQIWNGNKNNCIATQNFSPVALGEGIAVISAKTGPYFICHIFPMSHLLGFPNHVLDLPLEGRKTINPGPETPIFYDSNWPEWFLSLQGQLSMLP